MWTADDLPALTDASTISRGRAYVRSARVVALDRRGSEMIAEVQGSDLYHVRLGTDSWSCDCPVGVTGAFCKHGAAVVIAAAEDPHLAAPEPDDAPTNAVETWLDSLSAADLRDLLRDASTRVPGVAELLAQEYLATNDDLTQLRTEVDAVLRPTRSFYDYRAANGYADYAEGVLRVLHERRDRPSAELLAVVERAIALTVRTILRSDDSSGAQGDQIRGLLDLHAAVADGLAGTLDAKARRRLATWLHGFRFGGKQEFFEVEVDAYADALGPDGVARYRELVEKSAATGKDEWAVKHARGRLAILDRDVDAIVRAFGGEFAHAYQALRVVEAFDDAGMPDLAVQYAERGLGLPRSHHTVKLVDRLVHDAVERGDLEAAVALRREDFDAEPTSTSLASYRAAAEAAGSWDAERSDAEARLAERRPDQWIGVLLSDGRGDEAWHFATAHPAAASAAGAWERLCEARAKTAPADTLPVYRNLITGLLQRADKRNYAYAARLLKRLRDASQRAGQGEEFRAFLAQTVEANRRRPTCIAEFRRARLL